MTSQTQPKPQGNYAAATRRGNQVFTAGMTPRRDGVLIRTGGVRSTDDLNLYKEAAQLAVGNAVKAARATLAEGEKIAQILNMTVYVASADQSFDKHSKIADFASDYLFEEFGQSGISSRAAVGVFSLPGGSPLEISLIAAIE
ncbi:MAG TPA: RidA family protein [Paenalcaligenes sp.]|nr:RidA family protein [Paenalcaligenes sp.]